MSAHAHSSSTQPTEATSVSPEVVAPAVLQPDQVSFRRKFPLFAIALAVAGTLPIGVGVGVACRAKSVKPAESATCSTHDAALVHDEAASVIWAWRNQQRADDLFRAGDFKLALQLYQSKENADSLRPEAELPLKIALCREALGQGEEALALLHSVVSHANSDLRAAALLAQSRIRLRRHEFAQVRTTLSQLLGNPHEPDCQSSAIQEDAQFLLVISCLLDDCVFNDSSDIARPISSLDDSLWRVPEMLVTEAFSTNRSSSSADVAEAIAPQLAATAIPADEQELMAQLWIEPPSEQRRGTSERLANRLLTRNPTHRLAGYLQLALGELAFQRGELALAAAWYGYASEKSSNARSIVAAYNQGVVRFRLHEYRSASIALGRFIDGSPGHVLCPHALFLRGRSLLELGDGELAAFDLKRAADLPGSDEVRAWATVYLGLAHLHARQPKLAAQEMFHRRDRVPAEAARIAAGFVVSLARLESLESAESLDRETLFMLRALSKLDPRADWLGTCGRMMLGRAYQHLNLVEQAAETFERALNDDVQEPFASDMKLALADCLLATGDHAQALKHLAELRANQRPPWSVKAGLRMAEWELSQSHHDECLAICRELLRVETDHAPILQLMGKAYEFAGHDELAAACFAGLVQP